MRYGRQTPVKSVVLPYERSYGTEAVQIYNRSGRTSMPWQELLAEDILAVNSENLYVHMKYGWAVPRRNGKSELLIMRSVYGITHGERVLYTAHRTTTSHNAWEKCIDRLTKAGFTEGKDFKTTKQFGLEHIEMLDGSEAVINFRTRSSKGGLGEGYDLLIIDEAQEYTADQETALKYVVTDSKNPQTLMCGTPPTAVSSGTVFQKYRLKTLSGTNADSGWAEWSVPKLSDTNDVDLWYETNPSLGYILTERTVRSELGDDKVDDNIQRLGLWIEYSQKSAINRKEWEQLAEKPVISESSKLFFGVKYGKSGNVSLAVAVRTGEKVFVEAVDCRSVRDGNRWIIDYLRGKRAKSAVIDGAGNQDILVSDMDDSGVKCRAVLPTAKQVVEANALFEKCLFDGKICHCNQPSLTQIISNCEHRPIGTGGGFGYTSILEGADVSLVEAVALAHWACANSREKKKQRIIY